MIFPAFLSSSLGEKNAYIYTPRRKTTKARIRKIKKRISFFKEPHLTFIMEKNNKNIRKKQIRQEKCGKVYNIRQEKCDI